MGWLHGSFGRTLRGHKVVAVDRNADRSVGAPRSGRYETAAMYLAAIAARLPTASRCMISYP